MAEHTMEQAEHSHPTPGLYLKIGITLFVLTAMEVALYELTYGSNATPDTSAALRPLFVPLLLALSAVKFALVAMFYMHLKQDSRLFSGVFVFPLIIAAILIVSLIALFAYLHHIHPLPLPGGHG